MATLRDVAARPVAAPKDGDWLLRGVPRFDAEGQFEGYVGTARAGAAARPAMALPRLALEGESSELLSEQAAFSYTVTHDLRAPIRVVEGFARILKEDYGRVLDRIGNDHLDRVLAAAARMNSMIDALLTLANLSAQPLARQPVNLSQLAGFVIDDLRRAAAERQVEVDIAPGMVVDGDPTLLRLVLENLLGNAWKFTSKSGQAHIEFGVLPDPLPPFPGATPAQDGSGKQVFFVRDDGAGFDMAHADKLFGPFQRLHAEADFEGTGIGLATVERIIHRHGGEVWAEGEVGRGATFYFTL
jgi:signal transduction histidine kinase